MAKQIIIFIIIFISIASTILSNAELINNQLIDGFKVAQGFKQKTNISNNRRFIEGDILIPSKIKGKKNTNRYITRSQGKHWPNARVPYYYDSGTFNDQQLKLLFSAFKFFTDNTCVRWIPTKGNEKYWVHFTKNENACYSGVGRTHRGSHPVNLGDDCFNKYTIIHELMHRIGFIHEQSRPDRDKYIHILYENIINENKYIFDKHPNLFSYEYGLPYDLSSVMHYTAKAFSKNGKDTIRAWNGGRLSCEQYGIAFRDCPTKADIWKINSVYDDCFGG